MIEEYITKHESTPNSDSIGYVQPLIRCKDCKYWIPGKITDNDDFNSPWCRRNGGGWSANDYCSDGERKES